MIGDDATELSVTLVLALLLCVIAIYDLRHMRIPDLLNGVVFIAGMIAVLLLGRMSLQWALISSVTGGLSIWGIRWMYQRLRHRSGLGLGDVKLVAAAGPWIGLEGLPTMILAASLTALIAVGAFYILRRPVALTQRLPFGPFLALGLGVVWLMGPL